MDDNKIKNTMDIIQYVPFSSFVHPSFWHTLTEMKLNVDRLNETTKQIYGRFNYRDDIGTVFEVDGTSFNSTPHSEQYCENVIGTILNKNTIEEFKNIDKAALLNSFGEAISAAIKNKDWITNPNSLLNFFILSFADLKKFHYYYWFAFPSPSQPTVHLKQSADIGTHFSNEEMISLQEGHRALPHTQKIMFIFNKENNSVVPFAEIFDPKEMKQDLQKDLTQLYFGFIDPSNSQNPGWPMRLLIAAVLDHCPGLAAKEINIIGLRLSATGAVGKSMLFQVFIPENVQSIESAGWVGWERNDKGNFGPKLANMSSSMDPIKLADASADLNIALMKWRLAPTLDVGVMKRTRCLLLGAGTLGCHVARGLLAWGFRHITFLDSGKVSYSNPTRQVLYNYQDCQGGGRHKAHAAAESMKNILPTVKTQGIVAHIPMPGHPVGEALREETIANIDKITQAIASHDAIFLLLDTREARWLPTMIAASLGKIVINAALGFDSYLVMRHGVYTEGQECSTDMNKQSLPGGQLGCYFCNDVTAPGNSQRDRTLDQQCTVTRPGAAAVAAALAAELLAALLQHPRGVEAPAVYNLAKGVEDGLPPEVQGVLGPIPHSIRGFLHSYQTVTPTCVKFKQCIACSGAVISEYRCSGVELVLRACESGSHLEHLTGLTQLHLSAALNDVLSFSDDDEDMEE